ncbi:MAG TPA: thioredoxin family protein [Thermoanaerobaculia bacterium]|nr:thioredoxin family protein [Thermoanaerobaculia bacterium]
MTLAGPLRVACTSLLLVAAMASAAPPKIEKAKISLAADRSAYPPGSTARIAVVLDIEHDWHTNSNQPTFDFLIPTTAEIQAPAGWSPARLTYPAGVMRTFAFADQPLSVYEGKVVVVAELAVPPGAAAGSKATVAAKVRYQACDHSQCLAPVTKELAVELSLGPGGKSQNQELFTAGSPTTGSPGGGLPGAGGRGRGLAGILLLGFLGGLILNAMPCVLPVLSLKVFGLVHSASHGRQAVAAGALATSAGILFSFWALAGAAVAAKAAGAAVGWGVQFQNPTFVTVLLVVVTLFCLNLWGLFEIPLPSFLARASSLGGREGLAGHFSTGLFATLMATPCSAPFLGTALGFALGEPAVTVFAVFTAIALGFALPYLLLAARPALAQKLPRPGRWMDLVRGLMGFLLAASGIWLAFVLSAQVTSVRLSLIGLALLGIALFVWFRRQTAQGSAGGRLALAGALAAVALTVYLATSADGPGTQALDLGASDGRIAWTAFDRAQAESLAEEGRLVFVDVTADWCFTCKFNEKLVLNTEEVATAFSAHGVVPMKADWTNRNEEIGRFLADFGKAGIPFYVLYRPGGEPHVFSELLTKQAVIEALQGSAAARLAER